MKTIQVAALLSLSVGSMAFGQQAVEWKVADGGNGHWYARLPGVAGGFSAQLDSAQALGAHLATLNVLGEQAFILSTLLSVDTWGYVGGSRSPSSSQWTWSTGEVFNHATVHWASGNPGCCGPGEFWLVLTNVGAGNPGTGLHDAQEGLGYDRLLEWSADCNNDGIVDYGQILSGVLSDSDSNGVPDCCQTSVQCCPTDVFRDFNVNGIDLGVLLGQWGPANQFTVTDFNGDGVVDGSDLGQLLATWGPCPN